MRTSSDLGTTRVDYSVEARRTRRTFVALGAVLVAVSACGEGTPGAGDDAGPPSAGAPNAGAMTGGSSSGGAAGSSPTTGGATTGGATTGGATTGGASGASAGAGTGGALGGTGGAATGGIAGDGGLSGAAGTPIAGNAGNAGTPGGAAGAGAGNGGADAGNGGAGNGGAGAGGQGGAGSGSGGAGAGGKGGAGAAGAGGKGGAAGGSGKGGAGGGAGKGGSGGSGGMAPTTGCGATTWPTAGTKTIDVGGTPRTFVLYVPTGYDTNRPYPVIFSWHGLTGSQGGFYSLNTAARAGSSAIMVSPQGLDNANGDGFGWWNTNGQDLAFVDALIAYLSANHCVDRNRLFSVGFSFGGMFSHLIGCERGNVFRAIAPIAGSFFNYYGGRGPMCANPVPMIGIHGTADTSVTPAQGRTARDVWVAKDGCTTTTAPGAPTECVDYQGCMSGYPVKWCEHPGTHMVPSFAADAVWNFFRQF